MEVAKRIYKKYGTNDPEVIASEKNITVLYEDLGADTWGYYTRIFNIPVIHVNHRLDYFRTRFAIAHELGHHFKHSGLNTPFLRRTTLFSLDAVEREANRFAIHLLAGDNNPCYGETKESFLLRIGIPKEFHEFY